MKKLVYISLAAFLVTAGSSMTLAAGGGGAVEPPDCKKGEVLKKVGNIKNA